MIVKHGKMQHLLTYRKMKKDFHGTEKTDSTAETTPSKPVDTSNMSVQDRIKALSGAGKKTSILVTSSNMTPKNIHASHISSAFMCGDNLITSDYTGFIKFLKVK